MIREARHSIKHLPDRSRLSEVLVLDTFARLHVRSPSTPICRSVDGAPNLIMQNLAGIPDLIAI
jgi:hypothetical protein